MLEISGVLCQSGTPQHSWPIIMSFIKIAIFGGIHHVPTNPHAWNILHSDISQDIGSQTLQHRSTALHARLALQPEDLGLSFCISPREPPFWSILHWGFTVVFPMFCLTKAHVFRPSQASTFSSHIEPSCISCGTPFPEISSMPRLNCLAAFCL